MRYRDYKTFRVGNYYHVFNRGNNKQPIFITPLDYLNFLKRLSFALGILPADPKKTRIHPFPPRAFSIVSYCLMPNHFHFLIRQNTDIGINKLFQKVCTSYVSYFNKQYNRVGGLFQDQFKAKLVDNNKYAMYVSAYIHNNPPNLDYEYSSYKDVINLRDGKIVDKVLLLSWFGHDPEVYQKFVEGFNGNDAELIKELLFTSECE